jgi:hypothetical protein
LKSRLGKPLDAVRPASIGEDVITILQQLRDILQRGALITVKGHKSRLRFSDLSATAGPHKQIELAIRVAANLRIDLWSLKFCR